MILSKGYYMAYYIVGKEKRQQMKEHKSIHIAAEIFDANCEYEIVEREILPEKILCPDCGGYTQEGLEFCDKCGGELE